MSTPQMFTRNATGLVRAASRTDTLAYNLFFGNPWLAMVFVFLFFWGLYPIAYLLPAVSASSTTAVTAQVLFTAADIGSKVLYGVLLAKICRVRSAAEGFPPAVESSPHLSQRVTKG